MIVPLAMTLYFSVIRYNLMMPDATGFVGPDNYVFLLNDPAFWLSILNTLLLIGSVLVICVVSGTLWLDVAKRDWPDALLAASDQPGKEAIICAKPPLREAFTPNPQRHAALQPRLAAFREIYRCRPARSADIKQATR